MSDTEQIEYKIRIYVATTPPRLLEMTAITDTEKAKAFIWDRLTNPDRYQNVKAAPSWRIVNVTCEMKQGINK